MSSTTLAALARENGITASLVGYQAPGTILTEKAKVVTITAPDDHPHGEYGADDQVDPFDMCAAHLRIAAGYRTNSGKMSAEAKLASKELARRGANRPVKAARKSLIAAALAEAGLLDD